MKIALLQYPIEWAEVETNLSLTEKRIAALARKADVAVLPEMFTTGFCTDRPDLAEEGDGPTLTALRYWARTYGIAIAGSYIAAEKQNLYNRGFFICPDGTEEFFDKRHLYAHGGEADFFTQGRERRTITYLNTRFCLLICYDLRFPVWSRNRLGNDYDVLIYCANWPDVRIAFWDALLPARMIENQCIVVGVNRTGDDALGLHYSGHSIVYDTYLHRLAKFEEDESGTKIANVDIEALHHFREKSPLWRDVDDFIIR